MGKRRDQHAERLAGASVSGSQRQNRRGQEVRLARARRPPHGHDAPLADLPKGFRSGFRSSRTRRFPPRPASRRPDPVPTARRRQPDRCSKPSSRPCVCASPLRRNSTTPSVVKSVNRGCSKNRSPGCGRVAVESTGIADRQRRGRAERIAIDLRNADQRQIAAACGLPQLGTASVVADIRAAPAGRHRRPAPAAIRDSRPARSPPCR